MERLRMALPEYSITWPTAPAAPILAMIARMTSLAEMPGASMPSTLTRIALGLRCHRHCVAITCVTSDEPMPKASAPSAPWVEVWESPQTRVRPGWVTPCSGPTTWTMPCRSSPRSNRVTPVSAAFSRICSTRRRWSGSGMSLIRRLLVRT